MSKHSKMKSRPARQKRMAAPEPGAKPWENARSWYKNSILQALVIVAAGFWVFWPAVHGQWIGDDRIYITNNSLLHDPARLWKAWFQPGSFIEYYPIHETLQWLQWQLWGNDTFGYHITNILLHLTSALLVWRLLGKFGLGLAWLGGLIFAVHPMTVDSVALVNEFKTSLSLPPLLLAMLCWMDYDESNNGRLYLLAVALFFIAMLCKITMMMFPFVLLLYAWWKRGRIGWKDAAASFPFFCISFLLAFTTQRAGEIYARARDIGVPDALAGHALARFVLIGETMAFYFSRCFLPTTPLPFYPQWSPDPTSPARYLPWLVLGGVLFYLWSKRAGWGRHAILGLGFFLIMLAPFSGAHWISYMKATWVLDHLLYIPILGLIGLTVAALEQIRLQLSPPLRKAGAWTTAVIVVLLAGQSHAYAEQFIDEETLCRYSIRHNPAAWMAYNNLGLALANQGLLPEAIEVYEAGLKLYPENGDGQNNLGNVLRMNGQLPEALEHFRLALQIRPNDAPTHCNFAITLQQLGRLPEAISEYERALKLSPANAATHFDYGLCLTTAGRQAEAIDQFEQALRINPYFAAVHNALGVTLTLDGRKSEAEEHFKAAIEISPDYTDARANLERLQAIPDSPAAGK